MDQLQLLQMLFGFPAGNPISDPVQSQYGVQSASDPEQRQMMLNDLLYSFEDQRLAAERANELRYNQILEGYGAERARVCDLYSDISSGYVARERDIQQQYDDMQTLSNQRLQQAREDVTRRYSQESAAADQSMISRGIFNTTIAPSVQRGLAEQESVDQRRLTDQFLDYELALGREAAQTSAGLQRDALTAQQREADIGAQYGQNRLNFIERREDIPPSYGDIANLLAGFGQSYGLNPTGINDQVSGMNVTPAYNQPPQRSGNFFDRTVELATMNPVDFFRKVF